MANVVKEWVGKEVKFHENHVFTFQGEDTVNFSIPDDKYKILVYTDSSGCISCNLKLYQWSNWMKDIDSISQKKVSFLFFMHPKNIEEMKFNLRMSRFNYPVCIDVANELNKLNNFPSDKALQTFLLDEDNRVIAIGNPMHNPKIKKLYQDIIMGNDLSGVEKKVVKTVVQWTEKNIDFASFDWKKEQKRELFIQNRGNSPLIIDDIITSCGCIVVEYSKRPVLPGQNLNLKVKYKAERPEFFNKTLTVYCNAIDSPFHLQIYGNAR